MIKEIWKDIEEYNGDYQISNFGRVKSFKYDKINGILLNPRLNKYLQVSLCNKKGKDYTIHTLVWDHFADKPRDGRKIQVDHKDENKLNNRIDNLQLLTPRENTTKRSLSSKKTSKYTGVHWHKLHKKWIVNIRYNGKKNYIGSFNNEIDAANAYKKALESIDNN